MVRGLALGAYCVLVWSGYVILARSSATGVLGGPEQASLRAIGAGLILLPRFLFTWRRLVAQQGWPRMLAMVLVAGPIYTLIFITGLYFAPASHGGVITPSSVPTITTLLAWAWLGERPTKQRVLGLAVIFAGVACIGWDGVAGANPGAWRGVPFFLVAASLWAAFTVLMRRWRISGLDATTVVSVLSLPYVPCHALWRGERLLQAPLSELLIQLAMQGPLTGVLATFAYARAVWLMGATRTSTITAMVPVCTTLLAWAVLDEKLATLQLVGMSLAVAGIMAAVLPSRRKTP